MKHKITKIGVPESARYGTAKPEEYVYGEMNDLSPPVEYYVIGTLVFPVMVGRSIIMDRENRCGVEAHGFFRTSTVLSFENGIAKTHNSLYKVEEIK